MVFGFGEGKIEVKLERMVFSPGEKISGTLILSLSKPKQARGLRVVFRGIEKQTYYDRGSRRTRDFEFHRQDLTLGSEQEYNGTSQYQFEFVVSSVSGTAPKMDGALGTAFQAMSFLSGRSTSKEWFVDASLDCPGFDVNKKIRVTVNER